MKKIAVIYTHYPHYREPVFSELRSSEKYSFNFFADHQGVDNTIRSGGGNKLVERLPTYKFGPFYFQPCFLIMAIQAKYDAYVILGNPYIVTNWLGLVIIKLRKRKTLLWTHGWLRVEPFLKRIIRNTFYGLADGLLVYGDRAVLLAKANGFIKGNVHPIYNSLDYPNQKLIRTKLLKNNIHSQSYFMSIARLVPEVRLDMAITALGVLRKEYNHQAKLIIVGDGPELLKLKQQAELMQCDVEFTGSCYDEEKLGELLLSAIAVVSPGKVGLLAMHALAYGVPVITHDEINKQMPEVEAIEERITGSFYKYGDPNSLAKEMNFWIQNLGSRKSAMRNAILKIEEKYTPERQRVFIENALAGIV